MRITPNLIFCFSFFLCLFTKVQFSFAQINLVGNPGFEIYDTCPDFLSQISRAIGWYSTRFTPDYFNGCAPNGTPYSVSVPSNSFGYRTAASGSAYVGFIARVGLTGASEMIGTQLQSPLQIGVKYFVSFKVSLAGQINSVNFCGINKLGVLFSTVQYTYSLPAPICNCSQIYTDSVIIDTLNWTRITGSFVADSNYSFINIGRFFDNPSTDSIQLVGSQCNAYYYVDDGCISDDSSYAYNYTYTGIDNLIFESSLTFFPNPVKDFIEVESVSEYLEELILYNMTGQIFIKSSTYKKKKIRVNVSQLPCGVYWAVVRIKKNYHHHIIIKL